MSPSVVSDVINLIRSDTKQSAIFRLLKSIPELSNLRNRTLSPKQACKMMKRQKIEV
jgi:hypothetical protein